MEPSLGIKEVIETLSKIFVHHGLTKVNAEIFRKAKFDKPEAVGTLLDLTSNIFVQLFGIQCSQTLHLLAFALKELGYKKQLWYDDENSTSSRRLLLAFSFLLVKTNIFERLRSEACDYLAVNMTDGFNRNNNKFDSSVIDTSTDHTLNELIVLRKKLEFTFRGINASLSTYKSLLQRFSTNEYAILQELNDNSQKMRFKRISLLDVLLQNKLKWQKQLIQVVERQEMLLKLHLKWMKNEHVFWKWMCSVAEEDDNDNSNNNSNNNNNNNNRLPHSLNEKLKIHILYLDKKSFEDIFKKFCRSAKDNFSTSELYRSTRTFLNRTISRYYDSKEVHSNSNEAMSKEIDDLETKVGLLEGECKAWMSKYVHHTFPNVAQLPPPRR